MKSFVISRYGLSSKPISEAAMQIKQAETVREFKPLRSLLWAKNKTKNLLQKGKVCTQRVYIPLIENRTGKFPDA